MDQQQQEQIELSEQESRTELDSGYQINYERQERNEENRTVGSFPVGSKNRIAAQQRTVREIVVPVTDLDSTDGKLLNYASDLAKTMSARITLLYAVDPVEFSEGLSEYAKIEKVHDYYANFAETTGESALLKISTKLEQEGIEVHKIITQESGKEILSRMLQGKFPSSSTKTVAVVVGFGDQTKAKSFRKLRLLNSLAGTVIANSSVPVFVVPY